DLWYGIASLQLSGENWTLSTEYMVEPIEWNGFSGTLFDRLDAVANGYYAQLSFKVTSQVELMARYGEIYADRGDRSGKAFSSRSSGLLPAHTRYSKVLTLGARWDATDNLVFRAEYQKHNGTFVLSSRENPDPSDLEPDWDLFAIEASYRF
ncbi:MAG: hypothetical protein QNJ91_04425, partial [Gammaproteobacteria bacterium]|nr:hypothetical protein [Gammaproteobacteria bacterium]